MVPAIFSFLLLAAHFSRQQMNILAIISLVFPLFLFIRKKEILYFLQIILFIGSAEWIRSTLAYVNQRINMGEDWLRLAIILFSVALIAIVSALLLSTKRVKNAYR